MRKSYIGCEVLGVNSTPRVSFGGAWVNLHWKQRNSLRKVIFPTHPCLTNSRGDSSIQGVINVSSN